MSISKLKEYILREVRKAIKENTQPQIKPNKPQVEPDVMEPGTKPAEKPKRRTLQPPHESPDTKPKAKLKESEAEIVAKITKRFKELEKSNG